MSEFAYPPTCESFDLANREEVCKLGRAMGGDAARWLIPVLARIRPEDRLAFFLGFLAEPASVFGAAGGVPMMAEALEWLRLEVERVAKDHAGSLN